MSRGRIRTVKPEWRLDRRMLRAGHEARIFSIVLLTLADDEGRGRWMELKMAAEGFAEDPDPIASVRAAVAGLTPWYFHIYELDGESYFQILKFSRHQYIEKPRDSGLPPCPDLERVPKNGKEPEYWRFPSLSPPLPLPVTASASVLPLPIQGSNSPIPDPKPLPRELGGDGVLSGMAMTVKAGVESALTARGRPLPTSSKKRAAQWNTIGAWVQKQATATERTIGDVSESLARGFADAGGRTEAAGWPLEYLANNPGEYLDKRAGPVTREEVEASGTGFLSDDEVIP